MRAKGYIGEQKAADYLQNQGYRIIEKNFYCKGGEIDIIAYKNDTLHFFEVKSGKGEPVYNITPVKLRRIIKCAEFYILKNNITFAYTISAVIVKNDSIEIIENLTL
ncbi:MAG: YraN family protein [Epsilonproteobacteria bacterium]|nr:YraN family protein [Campylobacterota bacterium]